MMSHRHKYHQVAVNENEFKLAVSYLSRPSDDIIVFIHELGCSSDTFISAWESKALAEHSLLAFDLPGFGLSQGPSRYSYQLKEQSRICLALLSQFPAKRIHIVGHGMGGAIGLVLTRSLTPASFVSVEGNLIAADCKLISRTAYAMSESTFVDAGFAQLQQSLSAYPRHCFDLINASPTALHRSAKSLVEWSDIGLLFDLFVSLSVPKVYIHGERNAGLTVLQRLDGLVESKQIRDSAHFPMIDNADAFYATVAEFIKRTRPESHLGLRAFALETSSTPLF